MVILVIGYVLHHFFVDKPLGLVDAKWLYYRFGLALGGLICFGATFKIKADTSPTLYKFPLAVLGVAASYMQTLSILWYPGVPYLWGIVIPVIFTIVLRASTLVSLLYCSAIYFLQFNHYMQANIALPLVLGAACTGLLFVAVIKRHMKSEVQSFIEHQEKIEIERKLVESKKEMTEQVQGFLPKVINDRISLNIENRKMTVLQAVDEELRPCERMIACLYSDIRSYTKLSKDSSFVRDSVFPDTHEAIHIVEDFGGIPRTIGDLVFAYFDHSKIQKNVIYGILSAYEIREGIKFRNSKQTDEDKKINRFLIMTVGSALVGNIGGSKSAREITAMGTCVNKSARMDELTKSPQLKGKISANGIILDHQAFFIAMEFLNPDDFSSISLTDLNLKVRDFEEDDSIWFLEFSPVLKVKLEMALKSFESNYKSRSAA